MPTKASDKSIACCGSGKFIAWIGFILATFALAGVIVVVADKTTGGATANAPIVPAKKDVSAAQAPAAAQESGPSNLVKAKTLCFDDVKDLDEFDAIVRDLKDDYLDTKLVPSLEVDLNDGWMIHKFCFNWGNAGEGSDYAFALRKLQGVTEADIKTVKKVVSFTDKVPSPAEFKTDSLFSLVKFKYAGRISIDGTRTLVDSPVMAVNGGPNQPGTLNSMAMTYNQKTDALDIVAGTVGGDYALYYARLAFTPKTKELKMDMCTRIGVGEELGEKWKFTCK